MADVRGKALAILRDGRVTVRHAENMDPSTGGPQRVVAFVASSRPNVNPHVVDRWASPPSWTCTCRRTISTDHCAHVAAVQLVTGWPSEARR